MVRNSSTNMGFALSLAFAVAPAIAAEGACYSWATGLPQAPVHYCWDEGHHVCHTQGKKCLLSTPKGHHEVNAIKIDKSKSECKDFADSVPLVCGAPKTAAPTAINIEANWSEAIAPFVQKGWKPFDPHGYTFDIQKNDTRSWGAGFVAHQPITFVAVCDHCSAIHLSVGGVKLSTVASGSAKGVHGASAWAEVMPTATGEGHVQFAAEQCTTASCKIRYTSFKK